MKTVIQAVASQLSMSDSLNKLIGEKPEYYMTPESVAGRLNIALRQAGTYYGRSMTDEDRLAFVAWLFDKNPSTFDTTKKLTLAQGNAIARASAALPAALQEFENERRAIPSLEEIHRG